jgi:hypothetical protein
MSNFICPHCGEIIDDGSDGFTSDREIELEKKLDIAVKAINTVLNDEFIIKGVVMTDKELNRWLRNLNKLKDRYKHYDIVGNKFLACKYKSKYFWFLKRIVKLVECDCVRF